MRQCLVSWLGRGQLGQMQLEQVGLQWQERVGWRRQGRRGSWIGWRRVTHIHACTCYQYMYAALTYILTHTVHGRHVCTHIPIINESIYTQVPTYKTIQLIHANPTKKSVCHSKGTYSSGSSRLYIYMLWFSIPEISKISMTLNKATLSARIFFLSKIDFRWVGCLSWSESALSHGYSIECPGSWVTQSRFTELQLMRWDVHLADWSWAARQG